MGRHSPLRAIAATGSLPQSSGLSGPIGYLQDWGTHRLNGAQRVAERRELCRREKFCSKGGRKRGGKETAKGAAAAHRYGRAQRAQIRYPTSHERRAQPRSVPPSAERARNSGEKFVLEGREPRPRPARSGMGSSHRQERPATAPSPEPRGAAPGNGIAPGPGRAAPRSGHGFKREKKEKN